MTNKILANKAFTQSKDGMRLLLNNECRVDAIVENYFNENELSELVQDCDAVISGAERWSKKVIASARKLKIIARFGVGYDNIDLGEANQRDIYVTNAPFSLSDSVAEHAIALMLCLIKRLHHMHYDVVAGEWKKQIGFELKGKTIGIIGLGKIGKKTVEKLSGFAVKAIGFDIAQDDKVADRLGLQYVRLSELLEKSDIVSIHCPLTESTKHLINAQSLASMKPTAYIINTSRGGIVDEQALIGALKDKKIAGAGLDVFEREPLLESELRDLDNVVLSPHVGSATVEARNAMGKEVAVSILQVFRGEVPDNQI